MPTKQEDRTFSVLCELIHEIVYSTYHLHEPPKDYKANPKYKGSFERRFKISGPEDIENAVISLIFGDEILEGTVGNPDFEALDRERVKKMWVFMEKEKIGVEDALRKVARGAPRRGKKTKLDSIISRIQRVHQKMLREEKDKSSSSLFLQMLMEKYPEDFIAPEVADDETIKDELFFLSPWLKKYKRQLTQVLGS